jgi:hypothetical protein
MPITIPAGDGVVVPPTTFINPPTLPGVVTNPPTVTTPSVPATTVTTTNTTGVDVIVYLLSGGAAVTAITVNGTATGLQLTTAATSGATVYLPAGQTISWTGATTAPTWVWLAA